MRHEQPSALSGLQILVADAGGGLHRPPGSNLRAGVHEAETAGVVEADVLPLLDEALRRHRVAAARGSALTLLVPPRQAPPDDRRREGEVFSALATPDLVRAVDLASRPIETWCFALLHHALSGRRLETRVQIVHRIGAEETAAPTSPAPRCEVILPHRGLERHVRICVDSLTRQTTPAAITVALDQRAPCPGLLRDLKDRPDCRMFRLSPEPVGPYVARHHLSRASTADWIAWQDSDDIALDDRLEHLIRAARGLGAGIVGSHELQLDEVRRRVTAMRYPLDASEALARIGAGHQVQFPTTIVRRDLVEAVGGLATHQIFGLDVHFWLAVSLLSPIANVDEFLYVRRRRAGSLTLRRDVGNASAVRKAMRAARETDFAEIQAGRRPINATSLAVRHRPDPVQFENMKTGEIETVHLGRD